MTQPNLTRGDELTSAQLLPCPFCGHVGITMEPGSTFRWRLPSCIGCGASISEVRVKTMGEGTPEQWEAAARVEAVKAWNTRAPAVQPDRAAAGVTDELTTKFLRLLFRGARTGWASQLHIDTRAALTAVLPDVAGLSTELGQQKKMDTHGEGNG